MYWLPTILILPYIILLLKIYSNLLKISPFNTSSTPSVFVSIVVACRNEEKHLSLLIEKISAQNYPMDLYEIIIVDDNSIDRTYDIASGFKGLPKLIPKHNEGYGKKQAIRTGIAAASGQLIITTDADCLMSTDWIRTIASFYEKHKPDMIVCPVKLESGVTLFGKIQELEFMSLQGITASTVLSGNATMCNGANLAFTKETYINHSDDLHEELISGDDIFFLHELKRDSRSKILWLESDKGMVTTDSSTNLRSFLNQRTRWISKAGAYRDRSTILLGIVTFIAIILQTSYLFGGMFSLQLFTVFLTIVILKSVPDYLILSNTCRRYKKRKLMWLFLPAQLLYPFYVIVVIIFYIFNPKSAIRNPQSPSFPSLKEI